MDFLPEDCIGHIFSFASPPDAARMSAVSSILQRTLCSDPVWARFLPSDYQHIVSTLVSPLEFSSMKELFFKLCMPLLIDNGKRMFWLDNRTAKKCYILSARELSVTWARNPLYWSWKPFKGSRFEEVAELRTICWLEIQGSITAPPLSPESTYEVYLIAQFANRAFGLDILPSRFATVEFGKTRSHTPCFASNNTRPSLEYICYSNNTKLMRSRGCGDINQNARVRQDGWIEIKLREFYNYEFEREASLSLIEVKGVYLKGGLIVEGIEIRVKE